MSPVALPQQCAGTGSSVCEEPNRGQPLVPVGRRALRTIAGYEAMNMIRKGQVKWLPKDDVVGQVRFVERLFGIQARSSVNIPNFCGSIAVCDRTPSHAAF